MVFRECNPKDSSLWIVVLSEHEMAELARQRIQQPARTTDDAAYTFTASTRSSFSCSAGMPSSSIPGSSLTLVSNFRSLPSRSRSRPPAIPRLYNEEASDEPEQKPDKKHKDTGEERSSGSFTRPRDPGVGQHQKHIMIVDDEPDIRRLFSLILENAGFVVSHTAPDGLAAVHTLERERDVDLLIIDQRMPVMDGIKASKEIKHILPNLKIVMVTAYDVPKEDLPMFRAVLLKPVSSQKLVQTISEALKD